ncbi:fungal-specific transcription factor domain-containing protein [Cyathus striatus]|nr:fungal-specific transcription factor domain-containing protein [Cyathus striatus]
MSSNDEESNEPSYYKKRKILRACDTCRRKKSYEPVAPETRCSNCVAQHLKCTYESEPKVLQRYHRYTEMLERRVRILEELVKNLCPDRSVLHKLVLPHDPEYAAYLTKLPPSSTFSAPSPFNNSPSAVSSTDTTPGSSVVDLIRKVTALSLGSTDDPFRDDDDEHDTHSGRLKLLVDNSFDSRFWGKSSGMMFMENAVKVKNEDSKCASIKRGTKRPMFWLKRFPWNNLPRPTSVQYTFPSLDLIAKLTDAYFEHVNLFYPLLHRPTFKRAIENNLHLNDDGFASVLLLVCAVGARHTDEVDKRTLSDGFDSPYSAGWKWYNQVQVVKPSLLDPTSLYDLQVYCLAVGFLTGCSAPQTVWLLSGLGIRLAQDVGIHRRRVPRDKLTFEDELWKRAFWVLIAVDRVISMGIGRPCALYDDLFDLDMPIECDDEYWDYPDPAQRFKQPEGVPSTVTAFNLHLRMTKIMAFAMRTIYTIKTKFWELILQEWEQHIVSEIDSALNNWKSSLPDYLRWDPNRTDDRFFRLSGALITVYYYVQILVHRPYIRLGVTGRHAARSCSFLLEQQRRRFTVMYPYLQISSLTVVIVLLLNIWGAKQNGVAIDPKAMQQVEMCMSVIRKAEERWYSAGTAMDILNDFASVGELMIPEEDLGRRRRMPHTAERSSDTDTMISSAQTHFSSFDRPLSDPFSVLRADQHSSVPHNALGDLEPQISQLVNDHQPDTSDSGSYVDPNSSILDQNSLYHLFSQQSAHHASSQDSLYDGTNASPFEYIHPNVNSASPIFQQHTAADSSTMAMWLNAPNAFELDEWNLFVANFSGLTEQLHDPQYNLNGSHDTF